MSKEKPKEHILCMVLLEVTGNVDQYLERLHRETEEPFPFINGSIIGADGSCSVKCLGMRRVLRIGRADMLDIYNPTKLVPKREPKNKRKPKRKA